MLLTAPADFCVRLRGRPADAYDARHVVHALERSKMTGYFTISRFWRSGDAHDAALFLYLPEKATGCGPVSWCA